MFIKKAPEYLIDALGLSFYIKKQRVIFFF